MTFLLRCSIVGLVLAAPAHGASLDRAFEQPPPSARPRIWWHWMNGNITQQGIRLDLQWMHRIGLGGVQKVDASLGTPQLVPHPLTYMSAGWDAAFRTATATAQRLGLEFGIGSAAGWSETGAPFVAPRDAMQKLVWSATRVEGGSVFDGRLRSAPDVAGPFQDVTAVQMQTAPSAPLAPFGVDVAVIAYRLPADLLADAAANGRISSSADRPGRPALNAAQLESSRFGDVQRLAASRSGNAWLQVDFGHPRLIRSMTVGLPGARGFAAPAAPVAILQASDDGVSFRNVMILPATAGPALTVDCPPVTARYFRLDLDTPTGGGIPVAPGVVPMGPPSQAPTTFGVSHWQLSAAVAIHHAQEKAGFAIASDYDALGTPSAPASSVIAAGDVIDLSRQMAADGTLRWAVPPGHWAVLRFGASLTGSQNAPAAPEATGLEVDKLDAAKVRAYLDTYLGRYRAITGPGLFGASGLHVLLNDSIEAGPQNWTEAMLTEFERRRGYNPRPFLPALTGVIVRDASTSDRFLWDFRQTISDLLAENHYGEIARNAHARGMIVYGEALEDHRPQLGDDMEMRRYADVPMGAMWVVPDGGVPRETFVADDRGAASVAHVYGQNIVGAESMTAFGQPWSFAPRDLKRTADLEFALGINRIVIHESAHQPWGDEESDKKPGMALSPLLGQYFSRTETWAEQARPWIDYLSRSSLLLQQGHFVADFAYFYGESAPLTAQFGEHAPADAPVGYGYDFVNSDVLLHRLSVENGDLVSGGGARYHLLYLGSGSTRMTLAMLRRLAALAEAGATIVGDKPVGSPSLADDDQTFQAVSGQLWPAEAGSDSGYQVGAGRVFTRRSIADILQRKGFTADVAFQAPPTAALMSVHRHGPALDIYFVTNQANQPVHADALFRIAGKAAEIWHADDGTRSAASYWNVGSRTLVPLNLAAHEAVFIVFRRPAKETSRVTEATVEHRLVTVDGPWTLAFEAGRGAPAQIMLPNLKSWTESPDPGVRYFSGTGTYSARFNVGSGWLRPGRHVFIDLGDVRDVATLSVNHHPAGILWKPPYRIDVTPLLRPGAIRIGIGVTNLWVNRLIGDANQGVAKYAFTTGPTYLPDARLRPSGLLGPVQFLATP